jgi:hypothetical protein
MSRIEECPVWSREISLVNIIFKFSSFGLLFLEYENLMDPFLIAQFPSHSIERRLIPPRRHRDREFIIAFHRFLSSIIAALSTIWRITRLVSMRRYDQQGRERFWKEEDQCQRPRICARHRGTTPRALICENQSSTTRIRKPLTIK